MTITACRVRQRPDGRAREGATLLSHLPRAVPGVLAAQLIATGVAIVAAVLGTGLDGPLLTPLACGLLLVFGLPHGTLDLELLRRRDAAGPGLAFLLAAYAGCALVMFALWQVAPFLALGLFMIIAVEHFAEDWADMESRFLGYGVAVALIATPALCHRAAMAAIFVALTGSAAASYIADLLLIVMPVAAVVAVAGVGALWQRGQRYRATGLAAALVAEVALPPVVGFALFFCFVHSPYQLRASLVRVQQTTSDAWRRTIVPLTLTAIGLAVLIGAAAWRVSIDAAALRASFVTLSVLTLPHMFVPYLARCYGTDAVRLAAAVAPR